MTSKIDKLVELSKLLSDKETLNTTLLSFYSKFRMGQLISRLHMEKVKGMAVSELILFLCIFRMCEGSIHHFYKNGFYNLLDKCGKNCFYRLLCREQMDWRSLLLGFSKSFFRIIRNENALEISVPDCFIIDDTTLSKTGKHIEHIGRVFDHTTHKYVLGFKALTLSYFDGRSTIPCDFSLHSEKGKKGNHGLDKKTLSERFKKKRACTSFGKQRELELDKPKTEVALEMVKRSWKKGLKASYILMDSWFPSTNFIYELRQIGKGALHVLCLMKNGNTKYSIGDKKYSAKELIISKERTYKRNCKKYKSQYIKVDAYLGETPVRLFLIRYHRNQNWNIILTTDLSLDFTKAFELYQIRWNTEVLYKECRQYLGLGKCQSRDFDAQIADCTLTFISYTILALRKRFSDYETMGDMFRMFRDELLILTLWQRMLPLIAKMLQHLASIMNYSWDEFMNIFFNDKEAQEKFLLIQEALESKMHDG